MHENIIGLKEFRENVDNYAKAVKKGMSFIVVKRSKPIFRLSPPFEEDGWNTVIDFTKIRKGGVPFEKVQSVLKRINKNGQN